MKTKVMILLAAAACSSCWYSHPYLNQGTAEEKKGDHVAAEYFYTKALEFDPENAQAYFNRGISSAQEGDTEGAMFDFNQAIRINPGYYPGYFHRGNLHIGNGDFRTAVQDL